MSLTDTFFDCMQYAVFDGLCLFTRWSPRNPSFASFCHQLIFLLKCLCLLQDALRMTIVHNLCGLHHLGMVSMSTGTNCHLEQAEEHLMRHTFFGLLQTSLGPPFRSFHHE